MKKTVCSIILSVFFVSTLFAQQTDWIKRISMLPVTSEADSVTPVLADVLNDSVGVAARFLPGCSYIPCTGGTDPTALAAENDLDFVISGRVVQQNGYTLELAVYDNSLGTEQTETVSINRSLEIFEVIDGLTEPVLNTVTGTELSYGALEFVNTGNPDLQCRMIINGREAGENLRKISRIPTGPYEITIQQISDLGTFTIEQSFVRIKENQNATVNYKLETWGELEVRLDDPEIPFTVYVNGIEQEENRFLVNSGEQAITVMQIYGENLYEYPVFNEKIIISADELTSLELEAETLGPGILLQNRGEMGFYRVVVDEMVYGDSPFSIPVLPEGDHQVRVEQIFPEGATTVVYDDEVTCRTNKEVKVRFRLEESPIDPEDLMIFVQGGTNSAGETIDSFYMMKYEVTEGLWCSVTGETCPDSKRWYPVGDVSWQDAVEFCNQLSIKECLEPCYIIGHLGDGASWDPTKNGYRLPSEIEWDWAAHGGINRNDFQFSGSNNISEVMIWSATLQGRNIDAIILYEVNKFIPNSLGLYGMTGNAIEWCWDMFFEDYQRYRITPGKYFSVAGRYENVLRGGISYGSTSQNLIKYRASSKRNTTFRHETTDQPFSGLRIVRNADE